MAIVDVSLLAQSSPRNIHRLQKPDGGPGGVATFTESVIYLNR